ncbi:MAG TPA: hypothetical protein VKP00_17265 [Gemmatimonadaceae bacterium]|nr:hypothetical protein [Gemmatimonadaceae bacterium]
MRLIHETLSDLRFAARSFKRSPGFAAIAFLTLVLGIAAVTSIFSYVDAVYFAALPYKDAERIVALNESRPVGFVSYSAVSLDAARLIRQASRSFERVSMYDERSGTVMFGAEPRATLTGLLLAAGVGRLVKTFLYGVSPLDPIAYATVCLAFGAVAIVACWWPARRVTRIDPLIALRAD